MTRSDVVSRVREYVDVPTMSHGRTRDGLDCAGLLFVTFEPIGIEDFHGYGDAPSSAFVYRTIGRYADRIPEDDILPGDVILLNFGGKSTHFGVFTAADWIVYPDVRRGRVVEIPIGGSFRTVAYFRMRGVT